MSSNGVLSFGNSFNNYNPQRFPYGVYPLIAPYWTDIDLRGGVGNVRYTVYTTENGSSYIDQVNEFLDNTENGTFTATMILVAQWIDVCSIDDYLCFEVIYIYIMLIDIHMRMECVYFYYRVTHFKVLWLLMVYYLMPYLHIGVEA